MLGYCGSVHQSTWLPISKDESFIWEQQMQTFEAPDNRDTGWVGSLSEITCTGSAARTAATVHTKCVLPWGWFTKLRLYFWIFNLFKVVSFKLSWAHSKCLSWSRRSAEGPRMCTSCSHELNAGLFWDLHIQLSRNTGLLLGLQEDQQYIWWHLLHTKYYFGDILMYNEVFH